MLPVDSAQDPASSHGLQSERARLGEEPGPSGRPERPVVDYGFTDDINRRIEVNNDPNSSKYPIPRYLKRINDSLFSKATAREVFVIKLERLSQKQRAKVSMKNRLAQQAGKKAPALLSKKALDQVRDAKLREGPKPDERLPKAMVGKSKMPSMDMNFRPSNLEPIPEDTIKDSNSLAEQRDSQERLESPVAFVGPAQQREEVNGEVFSIKEIRSERLSLGTIPQDLRSQLRDDLSLRQTLQQDESESKAPAPACVVCCSREPDCVVMPCGHAGVCGFCSISIFDKNGKCPICRAVRGADEEHHSGAADREGRSRPQDRPGQSGDRLGDRKRRVCLAGRTRTTATRAARKLVRSVGPAAAAHSWGPARAGAAIPGLG